MQKLNKHSEMLMLGLSSITRCLVESTPILVDLVAHYQEVRNKELPWQELSLENPRFFF